MKYRSAVRAILTAVCCVISVSAESSTRAVGADFDRCTAQMDRVERAVAEYDDVLASLKKSTGNIDLHKQDGVGNELAPLENRSEYFHNRIERASGQADKVRDDLKNVQGPTCPSCISSAVNMYCRNAESLLTEIDDYKNKASALALRIKQSGAVRIPDKAETDGFATARMAVDSTMRLFGQKLDSCADAGGKTLWRQAHVNLGRADSLYKIGQKTPARSSLAISALLFKKACTACTKK